MKEYPLFFPPESLAVIGNKNWKKKEAQAYFDWFMEVRKDRVSNFLSYINYKLTGKVEHDLNEIGIRLFEVVNSTYFYTIREKDNAKKLNNYGLAIAADMGLLFAQLLEEANPSLYWVIAKGPKSYHSYNLPVLKEFEGTTREVDVIFSTIVSIGISLNINKGPFDWIEKFNFFLHKAK